MWGRGPARSNDLAHWPSGVLSKVFFTKPRDEEWGRGRPGLSWTHGEDEREGEPGKRGIRCFTPRQYTRESRAVLRQSVSTERPGRGNGGPSARRQGLGPSDFGLGRKVDVELSRGPVGRGPWDVGRLECQSLKRDASQGSVGSEVLFPVSLSLAGEG